MKASEVPLPEVKKRTTKATFSSIFGRSLTLMVVVVAFAGALFGFFRWAAFEKHDAQDLFLKMTDGRTEVRRMAAVEWLRQLQEADAAHSSDLEALRLSSEQIRVVGPEFLRSAECRGHDPVTVTTQAALLGYARVADDARPVLQNFIRALPADDCLDARVMALVSLARLGAQDPAAVQLFAEAAVHSDPSVRKVAAFALGSALSSSLTESQNLARAKLKVLLEDSVQDVRWNAAIALAGPGRPEVLPLLRDLLERATIESAGLTYSLFEVYREAMRAALRTQDSQLVAMVEKVSREHVNLKLRQAAKEILSQRSTNTLQK
ncbi:MAG: HEAT repeat domain-containing protein [Bdellovibrionales bacterium]|nr:HEAT repeat domain-containing protein [Bdellovibrionales bacterium]